MIKCLQNCPYDIKSCKSASSIGITVKVIMFIKCLSSFSRIILLDGHVLIVRKGLKNLRIMLDWLLRHLNKEKTQLCNKFCDMKPWFLWFKLAI